MPTVPAVRSAVMVGTGQALMGMSTDAVEPQAAVTEAWMVPVAAGVPEMTLSVSERPAHLLLHERRCGFGASRVRPPEFWLPARDAERGGRSDLDVVHEHATDPRVARRSCRRCMTS